MKHTSGPWNTDLNGNGIIRYRKNETFEIIAIAVPSSSRDDFETDSNARLIAAAPELLEIVCEFIQKTPNTQVNREFLKRCRTLVARLRGTS